MTTSASAAALANMNAAVRTVVRQPAVWAQIGNLPLTPETRTVIWNRPIDALLDLILPLEDFMAEFLTLTTQYVAEDTGSTSTVIPITGTVVDGRIDGVPGDDNFGPSVKSLLRRLRIIAVYAAHLAFHPLRLAQAFKETAVKRGYSNILWFGDFLRDAARVGPAGVLPLFSAAVAGNVRPNAPVEGPLHRVWSTSPFRANLPEPPFIAGLGGLGEPVTGTSVLVAVLGFAGTAVTALASVTVAIITTGGTVATAVVGAIVAVRTAELQAQTAQAQLEHRVVVGADGKVVIIPEPGSVAAAGSGIVPWILGALAVFALSRR